MLEELSVLTTATHPLTGLYNLSTPQAATKPLAWTSPRGSLKRQNLASAQTCSTPSKLYEH